MNGAIEARLRFIDFLLEHYGHVRPQHLSDYFGLGPAQATRDLRMYVELAPRNVTYDKASKMYWKVASFERKWP